MCLFLHCLPIETAARVWDVLMSEGAKVIFRVGLTFFKVSTGSVLFNFNFHVLQFAIFSSDRQPKGLYVVFSHIICVLL